MDHAEIKNITTKHFKKLRKRLKKATTYYDSEAIHQFRVSYKKLRAFLRMISFSQGADKKIKLPGKVKRTYRLAGAIRDLQLQQQRILEITKQEPKKPWDYIHLLQEHINKLKPRLSAILPKKRFSKNNKKLNELIPQEFSLTDYKNYTEHIWKEISATIEKGNFVDTDIHAVRKHLKDLFYNQKEYAGVETGVQSLNGMMDKPARYYDELLEKMGDFQDMCVAIDLLKPQWLYRLKKYNRELLTRIKESFINEKEKTRGAINDMLMKEVTALAVQ